jgi:signal transduction histidine kinase
VPHGGLAAKYRSLAEKYRALVDQHALEVGQQTSAVLLALSALRASRSAMALVRDGRFLVRNGAWLAAERSAAAWVGPEGSYPTVDALGLEEAGAMLRAGQVVREGRFEGQRPHRMLHLRCERLQRRGSPVVLLIARDVTERARAEREVARARELIAEQERTRAVGQLASGVAHDLNNVLHAMALRLQALRREAPASPRQRDGLAALTRLVEDAATRVARLQDLAQRRQDAPGGDADLAAVVRDAVETARPELEHGGHLRAAPVCVTTELAPVPRVVGSAPELRNVFLNLLLNARDAMPAGGAIRVSAVARGDRVVARVEDDGRGIPPEALPRLFDPFFTTKGDKGTGLGLAIARSVMTRLGGDIRAANGPTRGAVFELEFPVSNLPRPPVSTPVPSPPGGARVLVVDDDADVLEAARLVLEDLGQEVATCGSGAAALARIRGGEQPDVVLCDMAMPDLTGWQVAEALRSLAPEVRVYLVTGWAHEIAPTDPRRDLVQGILPKPLPMDALAAIFGPCSGNGVGKRKPAPSVTTERFR